MMIVIVLVTARMMMTWKKFSMQKATRSIVANETEVIRTATSAKEPEADETKSRYNPGRADRR